MSGNLKGEAIVIMGVCGAGKSTIGEMLAKVLNCSYIEADDFHPQSNKEKMRQGIPLSEEDRIPWLEALRDTLRDCLVKGNNVILGCSALRKHYREILRSSDPNYESKRYNNCRVKFAFLDVPAAVLTIRLQKRAAEGNHFMPATLLDSQLELLQIDDEEGIFKIEATQTPEFIINTIQTLIFK
ncbi:hypothetical protein ACFE04_030744 [Oxalis oulophora]